MKAVKFAVYAVVLAFVVFLIYSIVTDLIEAYEIGKKQGTHSVLIGFDSRHLG